MLLVVIIAGLGIAQVTALDKKIEEAQNLVKKLNVKSDIDIK